MRSFLGSYCLNAVHDVFVHLSANFTSSPWCSGGSIRWRFVFFCHSSTDGTSWPLGPGSYTSDSTPLLRTETWAARHIEGARGAFTPRTCSFASRFEIEEAMLTSICVQPVHLRSTTGYIIRQQLRLGDHQDSEPYSYRQLALVVLSGRLS